MWTSRLSNDCSYGVSYTGSFVEETFLNPTIGFFNPSLSTTLYSGVFYCTFADYIIIRLIPLHGKVFWLLINQKLILAANCISLWSETSNVRYFFSLVCAFHDIGRAQTKIFMAFTFNNHLLLYFKSGERRLCHTLNRICLFLSCFHLFCFIFKWFESRSHVISE